MKIPFQLLLCTALAGLATAQLPKKAPISRYTPLWTNSPFTTKPPPPADGPVVNPLDDYALAGVTPIESGGYRVILIKKKEPDVRITVDSGDPHGTGFQILGVTRKAGDPLGTVVRMTSGALTGTVSYDEKLITIAAPKVAQVPQVAQPQPGQPMMPGEIPGQPQRQPRPRVVPPPNPQGGAIPQIQPGQPGSPNIPRPERRRN